MVDSGAEIMMLISPAIARHLKLTWTPNSYSLVGVGGTGGADGYANEWITVRLGGVTSDHAACPGQFKPPGPELGCFSVQVRPLVMQESFIRDIGFEVLLGQEYLRSCIGTVDAVRERLDYSPAWITNACADFRCSVPVKMTKPSHTQRLVLGTMGPASGATLHNWTRTSLLGDKHQPSCRPEHSNEWEERPSTPSASSLCSGRPYRFAGISAKPMALTSLHPGFPQGDIPTRQQYQEFQSQQAERRRLDHAAADQIAAEARLRAMDKASNLVIPTGICYSLKELQASGRLLEGCKLDLTPGNVLSRSQIQSLGGPDCQSVASQAAGC
jgi:hypothetical protein